MNAKQLTVLAVLAAICVAATAMVLRSGAPTVASDRRGESVVPGLVSKANDITAITVREGADTLSIERRGNGFVAAESGYPIKTDAVRDLVASSAELSFEEARTSDPARYGDLGLADPGGKEGGKEIAFGTAGGQIVDFVIGNRDTTVGSAAGGMYIRVKGTPQTFLARGSVRLPSTRADWFVPVDFDVKRSEIKTIALAGGGRDAVNVTAEKPGEFKLAD